MQQIIRRIFNWIFKQQIENLQYEIKKTSELYEALKQQQAVFDNVFQNIDISVDVHEYHRYSKSWAVISLQGKKSDYIKFIDLGEADIMEIQRFLRQFERNYNIKIDASPQASQFLRMTNNKRKFPF